jgi:glycosyltransferase involved in cell wall biosynthesis
MKILVTIPALGHVYGGPSKSVVELAQALGKQGIDIDLITTNANGSTFLNVPLQTWIEKENYRIQYFPCQSWGDYKFSQSLTNWLFENIERYDMVQTNAIFSLTNLPVYWACQKHGIPYVVIPRGMLEPWALSYKAWKKRVYYSLVERSALEKASAIQVLTSIEAQQVKQLNGKTSIFIAPNGINDRDFERLEEREIFDQAFPETRSKTSILFLGRIDPKKGLDLLAPAFSKVYQQFPETHLVIAGPDNLGFLPTVQGYFKEFGCLEAVTFTGILSGSLKSSALKAASLYVSPSYSEGFSMSVLEGMASGLPCILTTGCNFPEAEQQGIAKVVPIDAESIANAILFCLKFPEQAKAMGDRARQFILEKYTWNSIAEKLLTIYTTIADRKLLSNLSF